MKANSSSSSSSLKTKQENEIYLVEVCFVFVLFLLIVHFHFSFKQMFATWSPPCKHFAAPFAKLSLDFPIENFVYAKFDVGRYPKVKKNYNYFYLHFQIITKYAYMIRLLKNIIFQLNLLRINYLL